MKFDLHIHTTFSDGQLTPYEVVDLAVQKKLNGIAITDHDTTNGIDKAIKRSHKYKNFIIIPGIEFSCIYNDEEVHILGYFIKHRSSELFKITNMLKNERKNRANKIINNLNRIGLDINMDDVKIYAKNDFIGRPHIAKVLIYKGYAKDMKDAFNKFLTKGKPGYVKRYKLSIKETIKLIHEIDGIAVLAHPGLLHDINIINYVFNSGIDGLEAIHSKHSIEQEKYFIKLSNNNNLIITGGSDFHGDIINGEYFLGKYYIDISKIEELKRRQKNDSI